MIDQNFAVIHAGLGHKDQAFALLDHADKDWSYYLPTYLATDARMDSLRSDPRFGELKRRVSLPEWRKLSVAPFGWLWAGSRQLLP